MDPKAACVAEPIEFAIIAGALLLVNIAQRTQKPTD